MQKIASLITGRRLTKESVSRAIGSKADNFICRARVEIFVYCLDKLVEELRIPRATGPAQLAQSGGLSPKESGTILQFRH